MNRNIKNLIKLLILQLIIFSCKTFTPNVMTENKPLFGDNCDGSCYTLVGNPGLSKCYMYISDKYRCNDKKNRRELFSIKYTITNGKLDTEYDCYDFMMTDTNVIFNYLFQFIPDSVKDDILYTYSGNLDTIFKDRSLLDYGKAEVIIKYKAFCYPLIDSTFNYVILWNTDPPKEKVIELIKIFNNAGYGYKMDPKLIQNIKVFIPFIYKPKN